MPARIPIPRSTLATIRRRARSALSPVVVGGSGVPQVGGVSIPVRGGGHAGNVERDRAGVTYSPPAQAPRPGVRGDRGSGLGASPTAAYLEFLQSSGQGGYAGLPQNEPDWVAPFNNLADSVAAGEPDGGGTPAWAQPFMDVADTLGETFDQLTNQQAPDPAASINANALYDQALQQLEMERAMLLAQQQQAIAEGQAQVAEAYNERIAQLDEELGRVRSARSDVNQAYSRYVQAVEPYLQRAENQPAVDTAALERVGEAAAKRVSGAYAAGSKELTQMLHDAGAQSPALAQELQATFSQFEGLVQDAIRSGTHSQSEILAATATFSEALGKSLAADARLDGKVDNELLNAELQARAAVITDEISATIEARDAAMAEARRQIESQFGNLGNISAEDAWNYAWSIYAGQQGWNFQDDYIVRSGVDTLIGEGITTAAQARDYFLNSVANANLLQLDAVVSSYLGEGALQALVDAGVFDPSGTLVSGQWGDYTDTIADTLFALFDTQGLIPVGSASWDADGFRNALGQWVATADSVDNYQDIIDGVGLWEHHVQEWTDPYAAGGVYDSTNLGGYYAMSNRQRREHPAYQQQAAVVTGLGQQLANAFGIRFEQWRSLDEYADDTGSEDRAPGPRHSRSDHYWGGALDVFGSTGQMDQVAQFLEAHKEQYGIRYVLWQTSGHYDHVHVSFWPPGVYGSDGGGIVASGDTDDATESPGGSGGGGVHVVV